MDITTAVLTFNYIPYVKACMLPMYVGRVYVNSAGHEGIILMISP